MKFRLVGFCFLTLCAAGATAQNSGDSSAANAAASSPPAADVPAPTAKRPLLKYAAPKPAGSPGARIDGDGGSRGTGARDAAIYLLVPEGEALTTQKQPSLFYFQRGGDAASGSRLTVTVVDPAHSAPLLKARAENPEPGFRRVQLARHSVELQPGVRYEWRVSLGGEREGRSSDVFASGVIRYVEPSPELAKALEESPGMRAEIYAQHGIWYDALEEISNRILTEPKKQEWEEARSSLLKQVGLGRILEIGKGR